MLNKKILNLFKVSTLALFVAAEFFGFGSLVQTQAASCDYHIDFSSDKYTASLDDTLNLTAVVTRSGDISSCLNSLGFELKLDDRVIDRTVKAFNGATTNPAIFKFVLKNYDQSKLRTPNVFNFQVGAYDTGYFATTVTASDIITINASGSAGSQGKLHVSVQTSNISPQFTNGDKTDVVITVDNMDVLRSAITDINLELYVNTKKVGSYKQVSTAFANPQLFSDLVVNLDNGFINGQNKITVKLWQYGTNLKLGEGYATMNAQSLTSSTANPSAPAGGKIYACKGADGKYYCSGQANLSDISDLCPKPLQSIQVDSNLCNKTDAEIKAASGSVDKTPATSGNCDTKNPDPKRCLYNPLPEDELTPMFLFIIKAFLGIMGIWAVMFIIVGGFRMVMAAGNEEQYLAAKKTLTWAVLGMVVALLSFSIVAIVQNLLGSNTKTF